MRPYKIHLPWAVRALRGFAAGLAVCILLAGQSTAALTEADFLPPEQAFAFSATLSAPDTLKVQYRIAPGYYMYRERFGLSISPVNAVALGRPEYPPGEVKYDPTFEKDMEVYHDSVAISVPLSPGDQAFTLTVTSQGCADAGLCYPPMDSQVKIAAVASGYVVDGVPATSSPSASSDAGTGLGALLSAGDLSLADVIGGLGWLRTAGVFLVLGVLLAFTPCVLPMIPILSSIVLGARAGQARVSRWRGLGLALAYVLGMSVVYTAMGVAAGLSGAGLAAWLQMPWVLTAFALLLTILALATFGAFNFQMPGSAQAWLSERSSRIPGGRATGALAMGALSALIVGPCVAAPLAGALLYISQTGDVLLGGAALFAMAWGMGVPLLVVGAWSGALLPKTGPWMEGVKRLFGMLLLGTAWWMLVPVLPTWTQMAGWAFLAIVGAVMLRAFDALPAGAGAPGIFAKGLGLLLALAGAAWLVGVASGGRDVLQPLSHLTQRAAGPAAMAPRNGADIAFVRVRNNAELDALLARSQQPVMLEFYADWCVSCREMERFTFSDPGVAQRMSRMLLVQADVTANDAEDRAMLKRFRLFGPPGIMFFAPGGRELREARVIGFQDARRFMASLDRVLVQGG